ncbi:hypothetical protein [Larkinella soli]|uniref:hypothetical protein n=1 Tax=Larkinella soli TaxID=1770527 RepID=UPI000FFC8C20|nr:hypothetical protein [Larkinella soli]
MHADELIKRILAIQNGEDVQAVSKAVEEFIDIADLADIARVLALFMDKTIETIKLMNDRNEITKLN